MDFVSRDTNDWFTKEFISIKRLFIAILYYFAIYIYLAPNISYTILCFFLAEDIALSYAQMVSDCICMFPILYIMFPLLKDSWKHFEEYPSMVLFKGISLYIPQILTNGVLQVLLFALTNTNSGVNQETATMLFEKAPFALAVPAILIAPLIEECIFRGIIFRGTRGFGFWPAALISGGVFGLLHCIGDILTGNWSGLLFIIVYTAMGVFMCKAYENSKNIFGAISLHMFTNTIAILSMAFLA